MSSSPRASVRASGSLSRSLPSSTSRAPATVRQVPARMLAGQWIGRKIAAGWQPDPAQSFLQLIQRRMKRQPARRVENPRSGFPPGRSGPFAPRSVDKPTALSTLRGENPCCGFPWATGASRRCSGGPDKKALAATPCFSPGLPLLLSAFRRQW